METYWKQIGGNIGITDSTVKRAIQEKGREHKEAIKGKRKLFE